MEPIVDPSVGLTSAEVAARVARGETNAYRTRTSRPVGHIVRENVLTLFNAILGVLVVVVLIFGSPADALFGFVIVLNAAIGIIQELRAKAVLDKLSLISAPHARVVRSAEVLEVDFAEVVLDDVVELRAGDQVPADGEVLTSDGLELDESLLSGESVPAAKEPGDAVLSGTSVAAGSGRIRATQVGPASYAARLGDAARRFKLTSSELRTGINSILKVITWVIVPVAALLLVSQLRVSDTVPDAVVVTAAGIVGMVPEGLVLLTSITLAVSVIVLGRRRVLIQELAAVEGLARVDVVCLDKTGTLTEGRLTFDRIVPLGAESGLAGQALGALAADTASRNATLGVIAEALPAPDGWQRSDSVAFRSDRKWSGASFAGRGTWVLGAPEVLADGRGELIEAAEAAAQLAGEGARVLMLVRTSAPLSDSLPDGLDAVALVVLAENVRADAPETLRYFAEQGVTLKIISGDSAATVAAIARKAGVPGADAFLDARSLSDATPEALGQALRDHAVFGRVTPEQKRAMVEALQADGHVVAMTGDGVNDVLAVKAADLGVAMGSGAAATRAVAPVVLLDNDFSRMPGVVAEGRRVIANTERVANLFVTKTAYAALLAVVVVLAQMTYPFLPRHLTLIGSLTIGIPGFFLSLAPNTRRYVPGFVGRVARFAIPAGVVASAVTVLSYAISARMGPPSAVAASSAAVLGLGIVGLEVLALLARPFTAWKAALVGCMAAGLAAAFVVPVARWFFALVVPTAPVLSAVLGLDALAAVALITIAKRARI
jgi:cation-transporting P-type ATPase E